MYIDPHVGGVLFQALAAIFAAVTGIVFVFARQIRSAVVRVRRHYHHQKNERISTRDNQFDE